MGNAISNRIVEGRILEFLSCRMRGGGTIYEIADELNRTDFRGAVGNWFHGGFTPSEVRQLLNRLRRAGLVRLHRPNGKNRYGLWFLNGGVRPLAEPRKNPTIRKLWGLAFSR
jgi:DNA-binding transcriptional ArsR family regulator